MWTAADPHVSKGQDRSISCRNERFLVKNSWTGNRDTPIDDCYYFLCPNRSFLYLIVFSTQQYITMNWPALPLLMLLQCHTQLIQQGLMNSKVYSGRRTSQSPDSVLPLLSPRAISWDGAAGQTPESRQTGQCFSEHIQAKHCTASTKHSPMHKASCEGLDIWATFPQSEASCTCRAELCWHKANPQQRQSWTGWWYFSMVLMSKQVCTTDKISKCHRPVTIKRLRLKHINSPNTQAQR